MKNSKLLYSILAYLGCFFIIEILSYYSLSYANLNSAIFSLIFVSSLALSLYRLEYGLLAALGELFIGSMGHLFIIDFGGNIVAIRVAIWLALFIAFLIKFIAQLIKKGRGSKYLATIQKFPTKKYFLWLGFFALIGFFNALLRGHAFNLIFSDINSWLYFLLLLPAIVIYWDSGEANFKRLKIIFLAGSIWLGIKTLVLLYIFTHNLGIAPEIYVWLRKTLVGEMTPTLSGWPRIFIQGQIFSGVALFLTFWLNIKKLKSLSILILSALFSSVLLISFSRSFWVALMVAIAVSILLTWRFYSWRKAISAALWFGASLTIGLAFIYLIAIFPYPTPGKFNADFVSRVSNGSEAALTSRWSLLPVLMKEIKKEPILGQGYGATITYISSDPRVLEKSPSGEYTTYAFEWGYLDLWLKIGLIGLLSYLILLFSLVIKAIKFGHKNNDYFQLGIGVSIVFLTITNIFTPYLNHPLGIGILIIGSCLIRKDRVY